MLQLQVASLRLITTRWVSWARQLEAKILNRDTQLVLETLTTFSWINSDVAFLIDSFKIRIFPLNNKSGSAVQL